jgi:putative membrane protein
MGKILGLFLMLAALGVFVSNEFRTDAKGESDFMMKAAQMDLAEIALGNLAVSKAQSEDVRRYGQMMVDDHTRTSQELATLAAGENVTLPTTMDNKHQAAMNKLSGLSGAEFDRAFMKQMVKDHEAAVKLYQKQANQTNGDAEVTAFAAKTLPALQSHLQMARSMNGGNMNNNSGNMNSNSMNMNTGGNTNSMNMNSGGNMNSNMNMNSNGNRNTNMNSNGNRNTNTNRSNTNSTNGNTNRNTNTNSNRNTNSNSNSNMNSNMNMR